MYEYSEKIDDIDYEKNSNDIKLTEDAFSKSTTDKL